MTLRLWLAAGGVGVVLLLISAIYLKGQLHGRDAERGKAVAAIAQAQVAAVEADLARQSAARVDVVVRRQADVADMARLYSVEAAKAEDANAALSTDRAARLRNADHELCRLAPSLEGCVSAR
ncbi:hypothetical protein [Phenylobacterium sp.]|uniref:hypothetical protein n=1 Tax=Phenylobacterium sp. TaxID=1871053 RepID=UPI0028A15451|nr:hypothetical protein [Phenylobacterium sp.]